MKRLTLVFIWLYALQTYAQDPTPTLMSCYHSRYKKQANAHVIYLIEDIASKPIYQLSYLDTILTIDTINSPQKQNNLLAIQHLINKDFYKRHTESQTTYNYYYFCAPLETRDYLNSIHFGFKNQKILVPCYQFRFKEKQVDVTYVLKEFSFKKGKLKTVKSKSVLSKWKGQLIYLNMK